MVGLGRLELPTSRLSGVRSNQLSYRPDVGRAFYPNVPDVRRELKAAVYKVPVNAGFVPMNAEEAEACLRNP